MAFVLLNTLSQFKSEKVNVMVRSASSSSSDMVGDTPVQDNEEQFPPKSASPAHKEYQLSQQQTQSNEEQFNIDKNEDTYMPIR